VGEQPEKPFDPGPVADVMLGCGRVIEGSGSGLKELFVLAVRRGETSPSGAYAGGNPRGDG
jgi:hypothetical protein